jgi:TRAP-type mannitol/chloroaromatic compound transport system permease small subunit
MTDRNAIPRSRAEALVRTLDGFAETLGRAVSWASVLMVTLTLLVVVLRYVFDLGWIAMQETITYLHAALFMLGAAFTLKRNGHVRVDILYQRWSSRGQALLDLLGVLFLLLPTCAFIVWSGWDYVRVSWAIHEGSREAGGLPGVFVLKTLILLLPALLALQGLSSLLRSLLILSGAELEDNGEALHG